MEVKEEHTSCSILKMDVGGMEKPINEKNIMQDTGDDEQDMTDEEKRQLEAHKLALMCYSEKLSSKEEEDDDEEEVEGEHDSTKDRVKFADTVVVCPTYSSQVKQTYRGNY